MFLPFCPNNHTIKAYFISVGRQIGKKRGDVMKTMIVREGSCGRNTTISARKTYRDASGTWVAVVDRKEYRQACSYVCQGIKECVWGNLHVHADQDDDGKEYTVLTN